MNENDIMKKIGNILDLIDENDDNEISFKEIQKALEEATRDCETDNERKRAALAILRKRTTGDNRGDEDVPGTTPRLVPQGSQSTALNKERQLVDYEDRLRQWEERGKQWKERDEIVQEEGKTKSDEEEAEGKLLNAEIKYLTAKIKLLNADLGHAGAADQEEEEKVKILKHERTKCRKKHFKEMLADHENVRARDVLHDMLLNTYVKFKKDDTPLEKDTLKRVLRYALF